MGQKNFGQRNFWVKHVMGKKIQDQNIFWVKWVKNLLGQFQLSKKIFCEEKNIGRVNPGREGVDDPPPQKIVGLKFCWVVVSFAT